MKTICKLLTFFITKQLSRSPIFWFINWNTSQAKPLGLPCFTSTILLSSYTPGINKNILTYAAYNKQYSTFTLLLFSLLGTAFLLPFSYILLVLSVGDQSTFSNLLTLVFAVGFTFICGLGYSNRPKTVIWLYLWGYLISPDFTNPKSYYFPESLATSDPRYADLREGEDLATLYDVYQISTYIEDSSLEFYFYAIMNDPADESSKIRL